MSNRTDSELTGYEERTISLTVANILSFVLLVVCFGTTAVGYYLVWGALDYPNPDSLWPFLLAMCLLVGGVVVHELIHGFFWGLYAPRRFRDISFGMMWEQLAPYCHCSSPLSRNPYLIGALAPLVILGISPWLAGFVFQSFVTALYGALFLVAAIGDIMVAAKVIKEKPDSLLLDHPTKAGYLVKHEGNNNT